MSEMLSRVLWPGGGPIWPKLTFSTLSGIFIWSYMVVNRNKSYFWLISKFRPSSGQITFRGRLAGKMGLKRSQNWIFQNPLNTRPNMLNAWNKCLPHHFGGCFARFSDSVGWSRRSKSHFLAPENGHFWPVLSGFWKIDFLDCLRPIFPVQWPQKVIWPDEGLNFEISQNKLLFLLTTI